MTNAESIPSSEQPQARAAQSLARPLTVIDVFRGLTILEVVIHHTTGMVLRYTTPGSALHELFSILNRTLHFGVPTFVFLSAVVLTSSLLKHFDFRRFVSRRLIRGGWPYLLWSVLYVFWNVYLGNRPPEVLEDPEKWWFYLAYGKAHYHLYFLLIALEVYLILPLLIPLARRKPGILPMLAVGTAIQFGAFFLNRYVLKLQFPSSTVLWYLLPVLVGVAVGAQLNEFAAWWRRRWVVLTSLMLLAFAAYLPASLALLRGERVDNVTYNLFSWLFTTLAALNLFGLAYLWQNQSQARVSVWLRWVVALLGTVSLQIYLIHPALQQILEHWLVPAGSEMERLATVLVIGITSLLLPAAFGRWLLPHRLSNWLFGR